MNAAIALGLGASVPGLETVLLAAFLGLVSYGVSLAAFMLAGVWLHVTERHEHEHVHERMEHEHRHEHDEHHRHGHDAAAPSHEPHSHRHVHDPVRHRHLHYPDIHHRHGHDG